MKSLYAIKDKISEELVGMRMYTIMCFRTDAEAARYFSDAINDTTSILNKHPADYELVQLGTLTNDGIIADETMRHIITGDQLLAIQAAVQPETN